MKQSWIDRIPLGLIIGGWVAIMAVLIGITAALSLGGGRGK